MRHRGIVLVLAVLACGATALASSGAGVAAAVPAAVDLLELPGPATAHGDRKLLLDVEPGGPGLVAVGEFGLLLASADQGRTWRQMPSPTSVMLTAVDFVDPRRGWAVGHDGVVLATADGGAHWQRRFDGRQANAAMLAAAQAEVAAAAAAGGASAPARRDSAADALAAARDAVEAGPSRPLLAVRFLDAQAGFVAGAFGQLFETGDGGASWRYIGDRLRNPDGLHLNSLAATPQGELFIAAEAGRVFRSPDRGRSWSVADTGYAGNLYGVLALPPREQHAGALLAYGFNGHLFRSRDRGASWSALPPLPRTVVQATVRGDAVLALTEDGAMFSSGDGGDTFHALGEPPARRRFSGFAIAGANLVAVGAGGVSVRAFDANGVPR